MSQASSARDEVSRGERYGFGANWLRYVRGLTDERISSAESALRILLGDDRLDGRSFLDIGSGSGLSSLAAARLGATVTSFDYDSDSVECTRLVRDQFLPSPSWTIAQGSVLDSTFMSSLPKFDIVYSWGVLHHTGDMYSAIRSAASKVAPGGLLCIALYRKTVFDGFWKLEKRAYSRSPESIRKMIRGAWIAKTRLACLLKGKSFKQLVDGYGSDSSGRGMDYYRDVDDWLGGFPYEAITPDECRTFVSSLGFGLVRQSATHEGPTWAFSSVCDESVWRAL